jgi:hypothetical protein
MDEKETALSSASTKELVKELQSRSGVKVYEVGPVGGLVLMVKNFESIKAERFLSDFLGETVLHDLKLARHLGRTILVTGPHQATGKSTVAEVLKNLGCKVVEEYETYELRLDKPLEHMEPDLIGRITYD